MSAPGTGGHGGRFLRDLDGLLAATVGRAYLTVLVLRSPRSAEVVARRVFSTVPAVYPVGEEKALPPSPWRERVLVARLPFLARGDAALAATFPDHAMIRALGADRLANFPIILEDACIGLLNIAQWSAHDTDRLMRAGPFCASLLRPFLAWNAGVSGETPTLQTASHGP